MQGSLALVVQRVRTNADSVAGASAEIALGNNDLSMRTEQQGSTEHTQLWPMSFLVHLIAPVAATPSASLLDIP